MTNPFSTHIDTRVVDGAHFWGYAQCTNVACGADLRPVRVLMQRVQRMAPGLPNLVENEVSYLQAVNGADLTCPDCGRACALLEKTPPEIPAWNSR